MKNGLNNLTLKCEDGDKCNIVFRQTDEDLQTGMHKILDYVKNHEDAWPFVDAVEEEYAPNYYSVIRKPMDLQRMEDRLDSGYYKTFSRFRDDFQLIVDNCRLYNGVDNEYTEMVGNLLTVFEKATERYLDQVTSSDEEIAVEYPDTDFHEKFNNKQKSINDVGIMRKPTLAAQIDKKRHPSLSDDSVSRRSNSIDSSEGKNKKKNSKAKDETKTKKITKQGRKKKNTKGRRRKSSRPVASPVKSRSRSRSFSSFSQGDWSDSPPPSNTPSSPDSIYNTSKRKTSKNSYLSEDESHGKSKGKEKQKDKWRDVKTNSVDKKNDAKEFKHKERSQSPPKQKDKHNKLRETIEKLKAKSEISNKIRTEDLDDRAKENEKDHDNKNRRYDSFQNKLKGNSKNKKYSVHEDENSSGESIQSEIKKSSKKDSKGCGTKNAAIEALTLATEQTLKDINKWLDDTPRLSEFSSASNSPSHYIGTEEFDNISNKIDNDYRKRLEKPILRKDVMNKEVKRRTFHRDPTKFLKKREVQRTIDRLQPGKSKGNLLSNLQNSNKVDDVFPLGPLAKIKDTKNSLIVKTAESTPKLSLGSVLDSFGKHKFVDDVKKDEDKAFVIKKSEMPTEEIETPKVLKVEAKAEKKDVKMENAEITPGKATPNLSAWFKAFGAPKVLPTQKKVEQKAESKDCGKLGDKVDENKDKGKEEGRKIVPPEISPNPDSPATPQGQPTQRQRKMSTGSTVSERSSFSQDMDSPRIGIDERLGAYPAPYPSPLHRSPSGASPVMASPRPDVSPKSTYPTVNGQIRVGFYQDTVSNKSSPEKTGSPQSPYIQYSEHVYTPASTESLTYSYSNPYYSQLSNYNSSTTPAYNPEQSRPPFYDTNKPLTDQYQAKEIPTYSNYQTVSSPGYQSTSNYPVSSTSSSAELSSPSCESYQQQSPRLPEKPQQSTTFPVKKRVYNQTDAPPTNTISEQETYDRNYEMTLISGRQLNIGATNASQNQVRPNSRNTPQQYVHQNIPNPRSTSSQNQPVPSTMRDSPSLTETIRNANCYTATTTNLYSYSNDTVYSTNVSEGPLDLNARPDGTDKKLYTNMPYMGSSSVEIGFNKSGQYAYGRTAVSGLPAKVNDSQATVQDMQTNDMMMRYAEATDYRSTDINITQPSKALLAQNCESFKSEMSIPRSSYTTNSLNMGNITNLTHIADRFSTENVYYSDKSLSASHMYNKPIVTSSPSLPMFTQPYSHDIQTQVTQSSMYNRQLTELQTAKAFPQQIPQTQSAQQQADKKSKRRKNVKNVAPTTIDATASTSSTQGFQSYSGLKNAASMEPSAISLKTASVVPGSAFNFGPAPTGLGLSSGLYGDKDTYPNFLEDYRAAPNYYMAAAAAAAHHRSTSETADKQVRTAHQTAAPAAGSYPFIGAPQPRPPSYSFMAPHQASPLMDASSPLYQQYLQAGVLHQGLLGPPGAYPPGYHPALSMRQPFDSMTRPSWL